MKKFLWLFLVVFCAYLFFFNFNDTVYYVTVDNIEKNIMSYDCSNDKFELKKSLIYVTDINGQKRTFKSSINPIRGKFDSNEILNGLEYGKTYKFTVIGVSIDCVGVYQNIIKIEEIYNDKNT